VFIRLKAQAGQALFERLESQAEDLRTEISPELSFEVRAQDPFHAVISAGRSLMRSDMTDDAALSWLKESATGSSARCAFVSVTGARQSAKRLGQSAGRALRRMADRQPSTAALFAGKTGKQVETGWPETGPSANLFN
jgi:hypothetical protein